MKRDILNEILGEEIEDPDEEHFLLFSTPVPSSNLGFLSSTSATLSVAVDSDDLTIHQSPGLLASNASSGTTGAVLWKISPLVAEWLLRPDNFLFRPHVLTAQGGREARILELGCGMAGVIALTLGRRVGRYVATDFEPVLRGLRRNLVENGVWASSGGRGDGENDGATGSGKRAHGRRASRKKAAKHAVPGTGSAESLVEVTELDWTECTPAVLRSRIEDASSLDCVIACDCIYNESLIDPFVQTCVAASMQRPETLICVVAQQLRSDLVFEAWLKAFHQRFHTWRVNDELLTHDLREGSGYVIHIGLMRDIGR